MTIILCGLPRVGKSTTGAALAAQLGLSFVDTDALLEEKSGKTCRTLYLEMGDYAFRKFESQVIKEIKIPSVISTGGGSFLLAENALHLKSLGKIVYLQADLEQLFKRFETMPAYFSDKSGFLKMARQRIPTFEMWADLILDVQEKTPLQLAEFIKETFYGK